MKASRFGYLAMVVAMGTSLSMSSARAQTPSPYESLIKEYKLVQTSSDVPSTMYNLYIQQDKGQVLLEIPKMALNKKYFIGLTVAGGQLYAGLQSGDFYVQWQEYNGRLALIQPNLAVRSTGDNESKDSVKRLFTGQVLLDLPILARSPTGGYLIDGDQFLVGNATVFFGADGRSRNPALARIVKAKSFPQNVELAFELPDATGKLQTLHYSISEIPEGGDYKPRKADQRIGYFTTAYRDLGKFQRDDVNVDYINRWHLKKRDPSLKISPPVEPITFYLEHTTPVRYRRWVKQGVLSWNKAFEKVGISDAIVVHYQDKATGVHMEKDPEDVRYNFIRWLNNDEGTAIGPSRVHPETGQILDADIILTDGWIRYFKKNFEDYMPALAMQGKDAETLAWLIEHPNWDPRVRFAQPGYQLQRQSEIQLESLSDPFGRKTHMLGSSEFDGILCRSHQQSGLCMLGERRRIDMSIMRMAMELADELLFDEDDQEAAAQDPKSAADESKKDESKKDEPKPADEKQEDAKKEEAKKEEPKKEEPKKEDPKPADEPMLDGMRETFVGPLLADLVAHEVGHTLGLRHNFKASSLYTLEEINSEEVKGKKTLAASVMDYLPLNFRVSAGSVQGDYGMIDIGPYDYWAIEYGYSTEQNLEPVLARAGEKELKFSTDEDLFGPDPLARQFDFSKNPLDFAKEQTKVAEKFRKRLIEEYVKKGDSWSKLREGYELTLGLQSRSANMMSGWIGGAFVNREKKGDKSDQAPVEVVPAADQRAALAFVLESIFRDESYALSPELLTKLTVDFMRAGFGSDPTWPVHDRILSIQSSSLTNLMNPTTLRRVYDNEFRVPADQDALTLPELLRSVTGEIWSELDKKSDVKFTERNPMISSLRRSLQNEQMERLIDLMLPGSGRSAANKAIANLSVLQIQELISKINQVMETSSQSMDSYTKAHLMEASKRMTKALEAQYVYNSNRSAGRTLSLADLLGRDAKEAPAPVINYPQPEQPTAPFIIPPAPPTTEPAKPE
ncbi:zinc-dependent metalloprotease [Pirellulaceae bacterium SH449]